MSVTTLVRTESGAAVKSLGRDASTSVETSLGAISLCVTSELGSLKNVWEQLQAISPCTPAQTYDWARAWARHVLEPAGERPVIAVGYSVADGKALFLWPFETTRVMGLVVLKWLGRDVANYGMGLFQPGTAKRLTGGDVSALLRIVAREVGVAAVSLEQQPYAWGGVPNPFAGLPHQPAPDKGFAATLGDFETIYTTRISGHARGLLRRKERQIAEHGTLAYGWAETRDERLDILDTLFAQKALQFAEQGIGNKFDARVRAFYRELVLLEGDNPSRLRLGYLKVGDRIAATHSGAICRDRLMIAMSSRTDGPLRKYSPGSLLLRHQIEEAAGQGLAFCDLGVGSADYKDRWCDVVVPLFDSFIACKPHGALLASALAAKARAKRCIKSSPRLWDAAKKLRRALAARPAMPN